MKQQEYKLTSCTSGNLSLPADGQHHYLTKVTCEMVFQMTLKNPCSPISVLSFPLHFNDELI